MLLPRGKPLLDYFEWPSGITLALQCSEFPGSLERELGAFRKTSESIRGADARIVFCKDLKEMPASKEMQKGCYKGLPWKIVCDQAVDGTANYFFYAPVFKSFLFVRTCLIPILKKITIERGGFFLIGSAFNYRKTTFILSGKPGSGKTRLLLKGLDGGGRFLGDSELMITADRKVLPVFAYVEARRNTLYGTSHWTRLDLKSKLYLLFCHILSRVSLGMISFNLLLNTVDNPGIEKVSAPESFSRCTLIQLQQETKGISPVTLQGFMESVEQYETSYQCSFGDGIYTAELRGLGLSQLKKILSEAVLWKISSPQTAYDFLQKEMQL